MMYWLGSSYDTINYARFTELDDTFGCIFRRHQAVHNPFKSFLGSLFRFLGEETDLLEQTNYVLDLVKSIFDEHQQLRLGNSKNHNASALEDFKTDVEGNVVELETANQMYRHALVKTGGKFEYRNFLNTVLGFLRRKTDFFEFVSQPAEKHLLLGQIAFTQKELYCLKKQQELQQGCVILSPVAAPPHGQVLSEWKEMQLKQKPESLNTLLDFFIFAEEKTYIKLKSAFVTMSLSRFLTFYCDVLIRTCSTHSSSRLRVFGKTKDDLLGGLNYILRLPSDHFESICLSLDRRRHTLRSCPLHEHDLRKYVTRNKSSQQIGFKNMSFSVEQSRILASVHAKRDITFDNCGFADRGASYIAAIQSLPTDESSHFAGKFEFREVLPFSPRNWCRFLSALPRTSQLKLDLAVTLQNLPTPDIELLELSGSFWNGVTPLMEATLSNSGPARLHMHPAFLVLENQTPDFMRALAQNSRLKEFDKMYINADDQAKALAESLKTNRGLMRLKLRLREDLSNQCWIDIISSISKHPCLREIIIAMDGICHFDENEIATLKQATRSMLLENVVLEKIEITGGSMPMNDDLERVDFLREVAPLLELNRFRKKFQTFCERAAGPNQASLLSNTMGRLSSDPSWLWLVMKHNRATVLQRVGERVEQLDPALCRKRPHRLPA